MFKIELQWKEFNIDLRALDAKMRLDYASYTGNQAYSILELWFSEELSQEDKDAIVAYWDGLTEESDEASSYESAADLEADRIAKKASAKAKLEALGLTEDELKAILG